VFNGVQFVDLDFSPAILQTICFMAIGQLARFALRTYGVSDGTAVSTSPDRGK
jgi:hypothetical protein